MSCSGRDSFGGKEIPPNLKVVEPSMYRPAKAMSADRGFSRLVLKSHTRKRFAIVFTARLGLLKHRVEGNRGIIRGRLALLY